MAEEITYNGKPLSSYDLWALGLIKAHLENQEEERAKAAKHTKFEKMKFPKPNPKFTKLKEAVIAEIKRQQNVGNS